MHLSVKSVSKKLQKNSKLLLASFLAAALVSGGVPLFAAHAEDKVHVVVGESALTLTNVTSPLRVTSTPYAITGKIRSLNQVQVYVDDVLADTIPLTLSDTELNYSLNVDPGEHEVRFVGISPSGTNPSVTVAVAYDAPTTPGTPSNPLPTGSSGTGGQSVQNSNTVPESRPLLESFNELFDKGIVALDFAKNGDRSMTPMMVTRFLLLLAGLIALVFAPWILGIYRTIRYKWLGLRKGKLPKTLRRHPLAYIRWTGVALILFVLLLL